MSFWRLYYYLVWTTKNREPLIQPEVEKRLYPYLVNKAAELGGMFTPLTVGMIMFT